MGVPRSAIGRIITRAGDRLTNLPTARRNPQPSDRHSHHTQSHQVTQRAQIQVQILALQAK
jgi:hypothetical protein